MAKAGMKRYKPGNGMDSDKHYHNNEADKVPELQGKPKNSNEKAKPL